MLSAFSSSLNTLFFDSTQMNYDSTCQTTPSCTADDKFSGELVECEWEAAEALTCLSAPEARDHTAGEIELSVDAAAANARITSELNYSIAGLLGMSRRAQEQGVVVKFEDEKEVAIRTGYDSELKTSLVFDLNYPPPVTSRTWRRELTEVEKEERRMRRVLANRESAKRTIRRRQAMREEMRRKADDLALENENLKKIKELAAAEYDSLKNKNDNLRMQIAKNVKTEVEETDDDSKSTLVETLTSTTSTNFLHNQVPLVLSPCFDGLVLQSGTHVISSITPPVLNSPGEGTKPSDKLESFVRMNALDTPLYIVSFPWQMQVCAQSYPFQSWTTSYPGDQHKTDLVHECSTSTPKTTINMGNYIKSTHMKVETKTLDSVDAMSRDFFHNIDRDFRLDEGGQLSRFRFTSSTFVHPPTITIESEIIQQNINTPDFKVIYSDIGCAASASNYASPEASRKWEGLMK